MSNHITRGTLPNPISMSPVVLFSPACLRSPEPSRPTRFDFSRTAVIQPSLDYNRALASRSTVRFPASRHPSSPPRSPVPSHSFGRSAAESKRSMGSVDYQSSATFDGQSWVTSVYPSMGTTLRIFALVKSATNAILISHI